MENPFSFHLPTVCDGERECVPPSQCPFIEQEIALLEDNENPILKSIVERDLNSKSCDKKGFKEGAKYCCEIPNKNSGADVTTVKENEEIEAAAHITCMTINTGVRVSENGGKNLLFLLFGPVCFATTSA